MSADGERFGLRFRTTKGEKISDEEYKRVARLFAESIFDEPLEDEEIEAIESAGISEIDCSGMGMCEFTEYVCDDFVEFECGDEIYGNMGTILENIQDRMIKECPGIMFELHWAELYGSVSDERILYNGEKLITDFPEGEAAFVDEDSGGITLSYSYIE